jgi:hypothetical protein
MRLNSVKTRLVIVVVAAVAACVALVTTEPNAVASAPHTRTLAPVRTDAGSPVPSQTSGKGCIVYDNITEKIVKEWGFIPDSGPAVGTVGSYIDNLYTPSGKVIGTAEGTGWIVHKNRSDGHLMSYYTETVNLPGGTIRDAGTIDFSAMMSGAHVSFTAVGTSGRFVGKEGLRIWWGPVLRVLEHVKMVLCDWPGP